LMNSTDGLVEEEDEASFNPSIMQTKEERELLEMINEVKIQDRSNELDVPELVVCGSQSAGKSSFLEALTTIPFPSGSGACTLFVTE
jgi:polynucleotide 5'-kinase involved in rRNA processing